MPTKRKDGRYQSSVTVENPITGERVKRYIYAYSLRDLEVERRRILAANISDFLEVETFHHFVEDFLRMKRDVDKLEESTLTQYQRIFKLHILPQIPDATKIADIKPALVKRILAGVAGDSARLMTYILLDSIFKAAKFEQLLAINPMDFIAWDTGLRRGEIIALRWSDFDQENGRIHVTKSRKRGAQEYEGAPKTKNSIRVVTLTNAAKKNLLAWKKRLSEELLTNGIRLSDGDYIFRLPSDLTRPMSLVTLTYIFSKLKRQLRLPSDIRFHSFRHTHATLLAEQEISVKKIQVRLGHASASFTMDRYVHNTDQMQDGIAEMIDVIGEKYGR